MEEAVLGAVEIVKAQAGIRVMDEGEMCEMVRGIANALAGIEENINQPVSDQGQEPAIDPKKSVKEKSVTCIECGKSMKMLSKKHLATHGLTQEEYKEKWGLKKNTPLICKFLARQRRQKMQEMQLWKRRKQ